MSVARPRRVPRPPASASPYSIRAGSSRLDARTRVLKSDETFVVLDRFGDVSPGGTGELGLYHRGTRFLSRFALTLEGARPFLLSSGVREDEPVFFANLTNPDMLRGDELVVPRGSVHIVRECRALPGGLRAAVRIESYAPEPVALRIALAFEADFADVFEVRGQRRERRGRSGPPRARGARLSMSYTGLDGIRRLTRVRAEPVPEPGRDGVFSFPLTLAPGEARTVSFEVECRIEKSPDAARRPRPSPHREGSLGLWTSRDEFDAWLRRSASDFQMMTTRTAMGPYPYAGIPWFSAPFGRDGIFAALQVLWLDPRPARGVLRFLAATQATETDPDRDSQPGKILHEAREGEMANLGEIPFGRYYGSVDATPLFVVLAGAYFERTGDRALLEAIWPHVQRALDWIDRYGDMDGDGFVEYPGRSPRGLANQGWKDSSDAVFHADGGAAEGPIALCEVQAYVYAARLAAATCASARGDAALASRLTAEAERMRERFDAAFWDDDLSAYRLALDGRKAPCRVGTSNAGHVLWGGIAREERAAPLAARLTSGEAWSGWGIRTVFAGQARYNPMSYHNGSVWPFDNAVIAAGFARYGLTDQAAHVLSAIFELSRAVDLRRLPELVCGFERRTGEGPTLYPLACAPQAWSAGAAFMLLQATLGLTVTAAGSRIRFRRPVLPPFLEALRIDGLCVGAARVDLSVTNRGGQAAVDVVRRSGRVGIEIDA